MTVVTLIAGCGGAPDQTPPETPRAHGAWQSAYVPSNGIRLHYWRTGGTAKPALVLAHGITDYGLNWASLAERFEGEYDIIMYDARGHGYSDKPDGPYDLATHVADLVGLIRGLGIDKPVLMGHSMGGATVALAAATFPDLARAVILEDPADMLARFEPLREAVIPDWKKQIRADRRAGMARLMAHARSTRHPGWQDRDYMLWAESKLLVNPNVVDILHGDGFGDASVTYPKLQVPTLILKADANAESRKKHLAMADLLPKGKLVHIDGAGHVIRNDKPAETERAIRAFLSGL
ncbi:MAG TPA: alpha/beta hydrolase [Verrucomicrobiota bacterium]|nr:alpha/beta hydrolase [Verrucomicrobiota bacterium]HNU52259.1 alpha/beta hydrolase [Verrucomicrobiota bacterium]